MTSKLPGIGFAVAVIGLAVPGWAADTYVLPHGAGTKDGSSWANARDAAHGGLQAGWDALAPGDTCFVGGGEYPANITLAIKGGAAENPAKRYRKLVGVDRDGKRPTFTGTWKRDDPAKGKDFITTVEGASYWALENLLVRSYRNVLVSGKGQHTGVRITNVDAEGVRAGFELMGGAPQADPAKGTHDMVIRDCEFVGFTKRGIRFQQGNYDVRVLNCLADAGGKDWATEPFQMGFAVQGAATSDKKQTEFAPDHDITFEDCVAKNSYNDAGDKYWNADGFCAESTPFNLRYIRCRALDNTDGGWDDKSRNPVLIDCVALRNKRNFRFWTSNNGVATLTNCVAAFAKMPGGTGTAAGLWTHGTVRAENCTFHNNGVGLDLDTDKARVELRNCIVSVDAERKNAALSSVEPGGKLTLLETDMWQHSVSGGGEDPQFRAVRADWDGIGDALNSKRYGKTKGYHSSASPAVQQAVARPHP